MKYLLTTALLLGISQQGSAQCTIPNGDMENWTSYTDSCIFMNPIDWDAPDGWVPFISGLLSYFTCVDIGISQSTTAQSGTSSAALWTDSTTSSMADLITIPSVLCNTKPATFDGFYRITSGTINDTFAIGIALWEAGDSIMTGYGAGFAIDLGTSGGWTPFSIPIVYDAGKNPDSVQVIFLLDADSAAHAGGSTAEILIDNISFDGAPSGIIPTVKKSVAFYPNPVMDQLHIKLAHPTTVTITDVAGNQLINQHFDRSGVIDMSDLTPGVYIVGKLSEDGLRTYERVIKQ